MLQEDLFPLHEGPLFKVSSLCDSAIHQLVCSYSDIRDTLIFASLFPRALKLQRQNPETGAVNDDCGNSVRQSVTYQHHAISSILLHWEG